ncbi:hypothetical protein [Pseudomonas plecoglossicida]|uniref:hypothetical protein n=1 Tax=Bacteria TaxID=2 RepID=UPI0034E2CEFE
MPGNFGTAENNNILTVQQAYAQALANGYMSQLQAYGVGRGMTCEEAEKLAIDNMGINIHTQDVDRYKQIKEGIDSARMKAQKEAYLNYDNAVSTGANKVKEKAPAPVDKNDNGVQPTEEK